MNDMSGTIVAKSDQINAADLIGTTRVITIKEVRIKAGDDQPVSVLIEGDRKAFRPCKGVRRLMVRVWGADASKYIGESMELFCDPSVTWAGKEEGGIRVSKMSGLEEPIIEFMRISRAATKPYKILPLGNPQRGATARQASDAGAGKSNDADDLRVFAEGLADRIRSAPDIDAVEAITGAKGIAARRTWLRTNRPELADLIDQAVSAAGNPFADDEPANPTAAEGRPDEERGEQPNSNGEA